MQGECVWAAAYRRRLRPAQGLQVDGGEAVPKLKLAIQQARRDHILDAAERCFARAGFHRTTMQDICREAGVERATAASLVKLAERVRHLRDRGLVEVASTRLLVHAGSLIASGVEPRHACEAAIAGPLSDDPDLLAAISELVAVALPS